MRSPAPGERHLVPSEGPAAHVQSKRWRAEFPYHWDADDLVSRRQLLHFAVYASGALFASPAVLAVLGAVRGLRRSEVQPIARASDVAEAGLVGAAGGLGGFFPPLVMGFVRDVTGAYAIGFMLLSEFALLCLLVNVLVLQQRARALMPHEVSVAAPAGRRVA